MRSLRPRLRGLVLTAFFAATASHLPANAQEGNQLTLLAFTHSGQIFLLPAEGGWPTSLTSTQGGKSGLDWSPDGKRIAYASQGSIWLAKGDQRSSDQ